MAGFFMAVILCIGVASLVTKAMKATASNPQGTIRTGKAIWSLFR